MTAFRIYEPDECGTDGYPLAWHDLGDGRGVKHLVREAAGNRCLRCLHPYAPEAGMPRRWTPCDERCTHLGPMRWLSRMGEWTHAPLNLDEGAVREAEWRILTVHHLRLGADAKRDLRWWNLAALCQRCHLSVQSRVQMERIWPWPHSDWFKPYAAGWYAWSYLGEDLPREQVEARLDELLALELVA
jgi:5-methylcytosine-specific restriction endonuclease McrA